MTAIQHIPQPVIAEVQGVATAAGCQLVATCDLAVAAETAEVRHSKGAHRIVLLNADGCVDASHWSQTRAGNVDDRRTD